jgi:Glycosyltransferase family 87
MRPTLSFVRSKPHVTEQPERRSPIIGKLGLFLGVAWTVALLALAHGHRAYGFELRGNLWTPGKQIIHGNSPYDPGYPKAALLDGRDCCLQALYPAPTHVLFAPLSWLPFDAAMLVFTALAAASLIGGLWLLGTRSSAAFGLILLMPPVWAGLKLGSIMPFLVLGCALCWRWKDRPNLGGVVVAATAVMKIFLWPLWLWLVFTRRYRAAIVAALAAVVILAAGWAVFGFEDVLDYPQLLMNVAKLEQNRSISLTALGGHWLAVTTFLVLLVLGRRSFSVVTVASLALLPVVWPQTLEILLVPLALALNHPETLGRFRGGLRPGGLSGSRPNPQPAEH